ncbi:hypothetical protein KO498_03890 [Lentibacter algarum]|uniref:hypothetical protein n=1 Tax=Lentibacter algarum TaxID=576131 RepID=UPI001C06CDB2|nr:hypothetical protein [Lentibacter algarum]MBU2980948.1 hypothetical protein [Lentibacter algarum]
MSDAFRTLLRPIIVAVTFASACVGIVTANYDFGSADLSVVVLESPTPAQVDTFFKQVLREPEKYLGAKSELSTPSELRQKLLEFARSGKFPYSLKSFQFTLQNLSKYQANDVEFNIAFLNGETVVHQDHFNGQHDLEARQGIITGDIPVTATTKDVDRFSFCISYRGRFFFNRVEQKVVVDRAPLPPIEHEQGEIIQALTRAWGKISDKEKDLLIWTAPCQNWP